MPKGVYERTEACRAKLSASALAQSAQRSEATRRRWQDPEYRARQAEARERATPLMRKALKRRWQDPEYRQRVTSSKSHPEVVQLMSDLAKQRWEDPEYRARKKRPHKGKQEYLDWLRREEERPLLFARQAGMCAICSSPGETRARRGLHLDHNHQTGKVRGLLCSSCNTGLGMFQEQAELLARAQAYLETHDEPAQEAPTFNQEENAA